MTNLKVNNQRIELDVSGKSRTSNSTKVSSAVDINKSSIDKNFASSLKEAHRNILDVELKEMLNKVKLLGEQFFRAPDEKKLNAYKDGIKAYLKRISTDLFSLKEELGSQKNGQQKVYQLVETINSEIDSLTREYLQKDKALFLLASLDEIRGLVLDLIT